MDKSRRKVLIIHESLDGGGAERVLVDLLRHMDHSRVEVTLLLVYGRGVYLDQVPGEVRVLCLNGERKSFIERVLFRCKALLDRYQQRLIEHTVGDERWDTVVSFMEGPAMVYHSMITARAQRNVTWVHVDLSCNHWSKKFHGGLERERMRYHGMDQVVCVSRGVMEGFERLFGSDYPLVVQHNPIDRDAIIAKAAEREVETRRFTLVNVARLMPEKRQDRIIDAVALLRRRDIDVDVWIAGRGSLEQRLKDQAARLEVDDRVKFWGFMENPYPLMRGADALLLTSDAEGYPTVVCESLCLGKPVISTPVAGIEELVGTEAGIVCEPTVESIASAIERLATSPELLQQCAAAATRRGEQFDLMRTVREIEEWM